MTFPDRLQLPLQTGASSIIGDNGLYSHKCLRKEGKCDRLIPATALCSLLGWGVASCRVPRPRVCDIIAAVSHPCELGEGCLTSVSAKDTSSRTGSLIKVIWLAVAQTASPLNLLEHPDGQFQNAF